MKKQLLFATLCLSICVASCQKGGYNIAGTVTGAQNGDSVFLLSPGAKGIDTLGTTTVQDGKFTLSGQQDTASFCYLIYEGQEAQKQVQFVLESGNIQMDMNLDSAVTNVRGTLMNEQWTAFLRKNQAVQEKAMTLYQTLQNEEASAEEKAEAEKAMNDIDSEMTEIYKQTIRSNVQNMVGQFLLANVAEMIDDDAFVDEQLAAINEANITDDIRELKQRRAEAAATAVGQPFKDIKAATPEGGELSVSEVAANAKVLMIDFWASWCGPCRQEMPHVKAAYEKYHDKGFEIIGVSLDNKAEAWTKAISDLGMTWPQISDLKGWECEGAKLYTVRAIPATVLIQDGKIIARNLRGEAIAEKLEEILK